MNYRNVNQAASGHMPFAGHRTCKQVREDEERAEGWRPPAEYRDRYLAMRSNGFSASEARAFILTQISTDERRRATFVPLGEQRLVKAHTAR